MTQAQTAEQQFLMGGGGAPSAFTKNDPIGTRRGGRITETPVLRQQTDFDTNEPLTWDDGNPRMHLVVTVATDQRDPANADDDGQRRFYVKGNLQKVVRETLQRSNATGLEVGGSLFVTRIGRDEPKRKGMDGAWLHSAEYTPAAANFLTDPPATQVPQQQAAPAAQPAAQPAAPAPVNDQTGTDPRIVAGLAHLPVTQQNAFIQAGMSYEELQNMGFIQ